MKHVLFLAALFAAPWVHAAEDSEGLKQAFVAECVDGRSGRVAAELGLQSLKDVRRMEERLLQPFCSCMHGRMAASFAHADEWDAVLRDEDADFAAPALTEKLTAAARACHKQ